MEKTKIEHFRRRLLQIGEQVKSVIEDLDEILYPKQGMETNEQIERPEVRDETTRTAIPTLPLDDESQADYETPENIKDFLNSIAIRNVEVEKVVAVVYYLSELKEIKNIQIEIIREAYKAANLDPRIAYKAVDRACGHEKRWLERRRNEGIFLTERGHELIEAAISIRRPKQRISSGIYEGRRKINERFIENRKLKFDGGIGKWSLRKFVEHKAPDTIIEKIAIAAYYISEISNWEEFDEHDIYTAFIHMGWEIPRNFRERISDHQRQFGYYEKAPGKKFRITNDLREYVERIGLNGKEGKTNL